MIRRAKLYARISYDGYYSRTPIEFDCNGRPIEVKPKHRRVTIYQVRIAGKFIDAGADFSMAVTRLRQEQARLSAGATRSEFDKHVAAAPPTQDYNDSGRVRLSNAVEEFVSSHIHLTGEVQRGDVRERAP